MNSEVTLEQLATLQYMLADEERELSRIAGTTVNMGPDNSFIPSPMIAVREARIRLLKKLLTTPPASGEVVGVPGLVAIAEMVALNDGIGTEFMDFYGPRPPVGTKIYMLSAAPKQAMGWRPIESAPRDGTLILLGREPNEDGDNAISAPGRWDDALDDGVDYMGHDGGFNDCDFQLFSPGRSFGHEKYRYAPNQPTHWQPLPSPPEKAGGDELMRPYHCPLCGKCEGLLHCLLCPMRVYDRSITYVTKPKEQDIERTR